MRPQAWNRDCLMSLPFFRLGNVGFEGEIDMDLIHQNVSVCSNGDRLHRHVLL